MNLYCNKCGTKLEMRECPGEPQMVPYCKWCNEYKFEQFNVAVIVAILSEDRKRVFMMKQYGRDFYNFLAGYVNKGESAEEALHREMMEEMGYTPTYSKILFTQFFAKTNTLMIAFEATVANEDISHANPNEVDEARWFDSFEEAEEAVIKGAVAERLLKVIAQSVG